MDTIKSIKVNGSTAMDVMHKRCGNFGVRVATILSQTIYAMQLHFLRHAYTLENHYMTFFERLENCIFVFVTNGKYKITMQENGLDRKN